MAIDEEARHALHLRLADVLGQKEAATMMAHLPPAEWSDVAMRRDVDDLGTALRSEIAELRSELRGEMGELRGEMAELRGAMAEFRGETSLMIAEQTRRLMTAMVTVTLAGMFIVAGLAFGAAQLTS